MAEKVNRHGAPKESKSLHAAREIAQSRHKRGYLQQAVYRIRKDLFVTQDLSAKPPEDPHAVRCATFGSLTVQEVSERQSKEEKIRDKKRLEIL